MLITSNEQGYATTSLADLFYAIERRFGDSLIAVGRPEPAVRGVQMAHVKIGYTGSTGAHPDGFLRDGTPCAIVHTAVLQDEEQRITLSNGHYDLTMEEAWRMVK